MVNDQRNIDFSRRSRLHTLYSEKRAFHTSPSRNGAHLTRPSDSKTSDFAACYRHSPSGSCDPAYSVTSHHTRAPPPPPPRLLLHTFPCSAVTWNPYVQASSLDSGYDWRDTRLVPSDPRVDLFYERNEDDPEEPPFHCTCPKCADTRCRGYYYPNNRQQATTYRTSIMTFRDQGTMTLRPNEAATAVSPVASSHTGCGYVVRDMPRTFTTDRGKPVRMKRNDSCQDYPECLPQSRRYPPPPRPELYPPYYQSPTGPRSPGPARDREVNQVTAPSRFGSIFKFKKEKDPRLMNGSRIPIYNEGISDLKAGNLSCCARYEDAPPSTMKTPRQESMKSKYRINESKTRIPYAHHNDSKFHHDCANPSGFRVFDLPFTKRVLASSRTNKAAVPMNYQALQLMPPAKNPRKLLTSERDVNSFVDGTAYASTMIRRPKRY